MNFETCHRSIIGMSKRLNNIGGKSIWELTTTFTHFQYFIIMARSGWLVSLLESSHNLDHLRQIIEFQVGKVPRTLGFNFIVTG